MRRREFLGVSATVPSITGFSMVQETEANEISVRQTAGDYRFARQPLLRWQPAAGEQDRTAITIDPTCTFQEILGFGGALTDAAAYMIQQLDPESREKFLRELYDPSELGLTVTRICIGSSDYSTKMYSYDEGEPDPELKRFSIEHDRQYILPQLKTARRYNPNLFLLASPWSPPGWMKTNGSMLGGSMKPSNLPVYAQYLIKFLESYQAEGVPVDAITPQNEVDTDQDGRMPACLWAQEHEIAFVSQYLGPELEKRKLPVKIWIIDHNFNLWGRAINELENPEVAHYADGVAWHPYVGSVTAASRVHDLFPDKGMYWTEGSFEATYSLVGPVTFGASPSGAAQPPNPAMAIARACVGAANAVRNWIKCIMVWNLVLDENGRPNIGPFKGRGFITIHSATKEITRSNAYWAMLHYTQAARRGARRMATEGELEGLAHVGFVNPNGVKTVVLSNTGEARKVRLRLGHLATEIFLPVASVTNLAWM